MREIDDFLLGFKGDQIKIWDFDPKFSTYRVDSVRCYKARTLEQPYHFVHLKVEIS